MIGSLRLKRQVHGGTGLVSSEKAHAEQMLSALADSGDHAVDGVLLLAAH